MALYTGFKLKHFVDLPLNKATEIKCIKEKWVDPTDFVNFGPRMLKDICLKLKY